MRFQMIDKILEFVPGEKIVGVKCITRSEDFLEYHFVGYPVMPGVLIVESMAQFSGYLLSKTKQLNGEYVFAILSIIEKAKFSNMVRPGEQLKIVATIDSEKDDSAVVTAMATENDDRIVQAKLLFTFFHVPGKNTEEKLQVQRKMFSWIEEQEIFKASTGLL
jgi:3-hydroxyacyl-[acyl-carrier-protein] dehydratase